MNENLEKTNKLFEDEKFYFCVSLLNKETKEELSRKKYIPLSLLDSETLFGDSENIKNIFYHAFEEMFCDWFLKQDSDKDCVINNFNNFEKNIFNFEHCSIFKEVVKEYKLKK